MHDIYYQLGLYRTGVFTALCPILALIICLFVSLQYHYESATHTHCNVINILPSLSATFGNFPEKAIWNIGVALHIVPRILLGFIYQIFYYNLIEPVKLPFTLNIYYIIIFTYFIELTSLTLLTYIGSTDNFGFHATSFTGFMLSSIIYMIFSIFITQYFKEKLTKIQRISLHYKRIFFRLYLIILLLALYFFYRHNTYCEPYVYSLFALCEYILVTLNIIFHSLAILDFKHLVIQVGSNVSSTQTASSHLKPNLDV